ncbi:MAG: zinc ribbon domain-containing protein [Ruminococcus sp.]|nr:zinc ribbon domain-containing protein [Ruminococcus sp.]
MFCGTCGEQIDDNSFFCKKCGAKIYSATAENKKPKISLEKPSDIKPEESEMEKITDTPETMDETITIPETLKHIKALPENHSEDIDKIKELTGNYKNIPEETEENNDIYGYENEEEIQNIPPLYEEYDDYNYDNDYDNDYENDEEEYYNNNAPQDYYPEYDNGYYPPPPPEPEYEKPVKVGFLRLSGAGIVTLFTALLLTTLSLMFCIKTGFSGDVIKKSFEKVDVETLLECDTSFRNGETVNDYLYRETDFNNITMGLADKKDFRSFILGLGLSDFTSDNLAVYADYLLNGGDKPSLTVDYMAEYMFSHSDFSHLNENDFRVMINNSTHGWADTVLSVDEWKKETGFDFAVCGYIFSFITLSVILALIIVLMIWTAVITDRRGRYFMGFYKFIFIFSGVICLVSGLGTVVVTPLAYSQTGNFICYIGSELFTDFGMFALATGGFELIVGIIFGLIKKFISNRTQA